MSWLPVLKNWPKKQSLTWRSQNQSIPVDIDICWWSLSQKGSTVSDSSERLFTEAFSSFKRSSFSLLTNKPLNRTLSFATFARTWSFFLERLSRLPKSLGFTLKPCCMRMSMRLHLFYRSIRMRRAYLLLTHIGFSSAKRPGMRTFGVGWCESESAIIGSST